MSRLKRPRQEFRCCTFRVTTGLTLARVSMSRQSISVLLQSLALGRDFMFRQSFFCYDKIGQGEEKFCRNRVWLWLDFLCLDKILLCRDRVGQGEEDLGRDIIFLCRDRVYPYMGFYVAIEYPFVATKFGLDKRF